jgi:hypothetical protein
MLDTDATKVMAARYIADEIRRGSTSTTIKAARALAEGFDVCDRQRAEHARKVMDLALTAGEREALKLLLAHARAIRFQPHVARLGSRAIAVLACLIDSHDKSKEQT